MPSQAIRIVVADELAALGDVKIQNAIQSSKRLSVELINRLSSSSSKLNEWIQNYGDSIGLSSKQILTADQIVSASKNHDEELKTVLKITDLSESVQAQLKEREADSVKSEMKSGPSFGM